MHDDPADEMVVKQVKAEYMSEVNEPIKSTYVTEVHLPPAEKVYPLSEKVSHLTITNVILILQL